jgi:hypothetical protein
MLYGGLVGRACTNDVRAIRHSRKECNRTEFAMILFSTVTARHRVRKLLADFCDQCGTGNDYRSVTTLPQPY